MKPYDFALYAKSACDREAQDFRVPLVDYLAMKFPEEGNATYLRQAADTIERWRYEAVKYYTDAFYKLNF